jgi:hypothetical protein
MVKKRDKAVFVALYQDSGGSKAAPRTISPYLGPD